MVVHRKISLLVVSLLFGSSSVLAQDWTSSEFVVASIHLDEVRDQQNVFQLAGDCEDNPTCVALLSALSESTGIPLDKTVAVAAKLSTETDGEGSQYTMTLPDGYVYCRAEMKMTSIVPHDGDRGSTFLGRADAASFYVETWTPVQGFGQGRSWVEADISLVGVEASEAAEKYADGTCFEPGSRALFYCRGGGCVDTTDTGQRVPTESPPGAESRN